MIGKRKWEDRLSLPYLYLLEFFTSTHSHTTCTMKKEYRLLLLSESPGGNVSGLHTSIRMRTRVPVDTPARGGTTQGRDPSAWLRLLWGRQVTGCSTQPSTLKSLVGDRELRTRGRGCQTWSVCLWQQSKAQSTPRPSRPESKSALGADITGRGDCNKGIRWQYWHLTTAGRGSNTAMMRIPLMAVKFCLCNFWVFLEILSETTHRMNV